MVLNFALVHHFSFTKSLGGLKTKHHEQQSPILGHNKQAAWQLHPITGVCPVWETEQTVYRYWLYKHNKAHKAN
jgi:hypothetical protein